MKMNLKTAATLAALAFASTVGAQTYFTPQFSAVTPENVLEKGGIDNMDRYSFSGERFATGKQTKNGWGKSSSGDFIDFMGVSITQLPEGKSNQNNDWIVSEEIDLTSAKNPVVDFTLFQNYGVDNANTLSFWVSPSGYVKGEIDQDSAGIKVTPQGTWTMLENNICCAENNTSEPFNFSLDAYKGQKIRIAFRLTNRLKQNPNNSRVYRIQNLTVKEK